MHTCSKPVLFSLKSPVWKLLVNTETFSGFNFSILRMLLSRRGRGRGRENTPHKWPLRGGSARLQVYERVGILLAEVYERVGKSVISVCKKT